MPRRKQDATRGIEEHRFGGDWTTAKLEILRRYLEAYTKVMKNQPFKTAYIDAFAGTGYRDLRQVETEPTPLFPDLSADEPQTLLEGSARVALRTEPHFDHYIFIEKDRGRCLQLEKLRQEFPALQEKITIQPGDANQEIQSICKKNWKNHRAVLFLDPYGMAVDWATIEAVAKTRAIDLWLLFPLGIGVNRLLPRSGNIPIGWRNRLNTFLGTEEWYEAFYRERKSSTLFGDETLLARESVEVIGEFFVKRLATVFPGGVAPHPRVLVNSTNCPLYLFCFAVGSHSKRARAIALDIANHILERF